MDETSKRETLELIASVSQEIGDRHADSCETALRAELCQLAVASRLVEEAAYGMVGTWSPDRIAEAISVAAVLERLAQDMPRHPSRRLN